METTDSWWTWFDEVIKDSKDFTDFKPLADFALEMLMWKERGKPFIDALEEKLLEKKLIKGRINKREDFIANHRWNPDFDRMLYYISSVRDPLKPDR